MLALQVELKGLWLVLASGAGRLHHGRVGTKYAPQRLQLRLLNLRLRIKGQLRVRDATTIRSLVALPNAKIVWVGLVHTTRRYRC